MKPVTPWPAALALAFNAMVWGVSWWPFRQLQALGLHPLLATALIYALCTAVVVLLRPRALGAVLTTPSLWVVALAAGVTNAAFNWAVTVGDVVRVVLLFYLMPLWAVLLAKGLLGERITVAAMARVGLALAGAAVVLMAEGNRAWPVPTQPVEWLALLGGFSFALNNVMLRREARRQSSDSSARTLAMFLGGAVLAGLPAWWWHARVEAAGSPPLVWQGTVVLGMVALGVCFLLGNMALQYGAARLRAQATAVIMLLEVLFASVSAWALGAASLNAHVVVGGAMIMAAAALAAWEPTPAQGAAT